MGFTQHLRLLATGVAGLQVVVCCNVCTGSKGGGVCTWWCVVTCGVLAAGVAGLHVVVCCNVWCTGGRGGRVAGAGFQLEVGVT